MIEFWESKFKNEGAMWKFEPSDSAMLAMELFKSNKFKSILIPGIGYGRNAKLFCENGFNVTGIEISKWLYLTIIAMSFYLGLGKRRNELLKQKGNSRKVLKYYNQGFLDKNMYMCLALTIAFYSLWSVDPITIERVSNTDLVWTVPFVILICMKYSLNIEGNSDGDPVEVVLKDKALLAMLAIYGVITVGIIYF